MGTGLMGGFPSRRVPGGQELRGCWVRAVLPQTRTPVSREELVHALELVERHHGGFLLNSLDFPTALVVPSSTVVLKLPNTVTL